MERHICRLCFRNFANGKALGGHMRSHMMKIYAAKIASKKEKFQSSVISDSSTSSYSSEDEDVEVKGLLSYQLKDRKFSQEGESETESSEKSPIRRRSKRVGESRVTDFNGFLQVKKSKFGNENSSVTSISDTTSDEDVAHCLIMLSRDKWKRVDMEFQEKEERKLSEEDYYSEDSLKVIKNKVRGKYRCETCNKLFRSYQALGGHRANHNKIIKVNTAPAQVGRKAESAAEEKLHECPFCDRVFSSGQALGGHKRTHSIGAGAISANVRNINPAKQISRIGETLDIDLNFPAPTDEEDEISQAVISAVSEAEFVHPVEQ